MTRFFAGGLFLGLGTLMIAAGIGWFPIFGVASQPALMEMHGGAPAPQPAPQCVTLKMCDCSNVMAGCTYVPQTNDCQICVPQGGQTFAYPCCTPQGAQAGNQCQTVFVNPLPSCGSITSVAANAPPPGGWGVPGNPAGVPTGFCFDSNGLPICTSTPGANPPACMTYFPPANGSTPCPQG